ncbi:MAG: DUF424 family protein [Candidatus Kariarchaeaceae archaeon]
MTLEESDLYRMKVSIQPQGITGNSSERLVAICDSSLIGSNINCKINNEDVSIKVSDKFYGEQDFTAQEVLNELVKATSINAIGVSIIDILIQKRFVRSDVVMWFKTNSQDKKIGHVIAIY